MDDLYKSMKISAAGMKAQGTRLRVIAENIANAESLAQSPQGDPYRRKTITFKSALDRSLGFETVRIDKTLPDTKPFDKQYMPRHPAADADGYVQVPNVNSLIEIADMREAERSYEANLTVIKSSKSMLKSALDILR